MKKHEALSELAEIEAARKRGERKRISARLSAFRGYGRAMGLPEIGETLWRTDYKGQSHQVTVIDNNGAYWSDSTIGHSGRWCTLEVPPEYVTKTEASLRMAVASVLYDDDDRECFT